MRSCRPQSGAMERPFRCHALPDADGQAAYAGPEPIPAGERQGGRGEVRDRIPVGVTGGLSNATGPSGRERSGDQTPSSRRTPPGALEMDASEQPEAERWVWNGAGILRSLRGAGCGVVARRVVGGRARGGGFPDRGPCP
jgi:hypothetical protein